MRIVYVHMRCGASIPQRSVIAAAISRKKKLPEKQKKGKVGMCEYGNVSIPKEAFIAALRMGEE